MFDNFVGKVREWLNLGPKHEFLVNLIKQLNVDDDILKCNQKIQHLLEKWKENCRTSDDVEKSFETIYQACLYDDELASKLAYMISSRTFISQEVRDQNIRLLFLSQLQKTVDGIASLYKTNPVAFRNCTRMLGEFFNKGRLSNGFPFSFMAVPLIGNLQILLENNRPQDLQLLATQLYMNGSGIKAECPEELTNLINDARIMLISNELTKKSKLWLLLCVEGAINEFGPFFADAYTFYQDHIGETATEIIRKASSSNVHALQVPKPIASTDKSTQFSTSDTYTPNTSQEYTSDLVSDSPSHNTSTHYEGFSQNTGKHNKPNSDINVGNNNDTNKGSSTRRSDKSGWNGKSKEVWRNQNNSNFLQESNYSLNSSVDKSSRFTSGLVSDSSSHNSSARYKGSSRNTGKHDKSFQDIDVGVGLIGCNNDIRASSTRSDDKSGWNGKSKVVWRNQNNSNFLQESNYSLNSSVDKSSRFTSGFVSDSSSHNTSEYYRDSSRNTGKHDVRYETGREASSTGREYKNTGRDDNSTGLGGKNNANNSSIDKSAQFRSGFVSDSSSHNHSSAYYRNTRKHDRPVSSVGARLIRYKTDKEASSTRREDKSGRYGKPEGDWGDRWEHNNRLENTDRVSSMTVLKLKILHQN